MTHCIKHFLTYLSVWLSESRIQLFTACWEKLAYEHIYTTCNSCTCLCLIFGCRKWLALRFPCGHLSHPQILAWNWHWNKFNETHHEAFVLLFATSLQVRSVCSHQGNGAGDCHLINRVHIFDNTTSLTYSSCACINHHLPSDPLNQESLTWSHRLITSTGTQPAGYPTEPVVRNRGQEHSVWREIIRLCLYQPLPTRGGQCWDPETDWTIW